MVAVRVHVERYGVDVTIIEGLRTWFPTRISHHQVLERAFRSAASSSATGTLFEEGLSRTLTIAKVTLKLAAGLRGRDCPGRCWSWPGTTWAATSRASPWIAAVLANEPAHRCWHLRCWRHRPRRSAGSPRLPAGHLRCRRDRWPEPTISLKMSTSPRSPSVTREIFRWLLRAVRSSALNVETAEYNLAGNEVSPLSSVLPAS